MGRKLVGGTKGILRGKVGNTVYMAKRDADGKRYQGLKAAEVSRRYSNTLSQAKNRCIMGQIQRMFHALPTVIKGAYASVPHGALSMQMFAKMNYPLLNEDFERPRNYYPDFDWRDKWDITPPAGIWKLAEGSYHEFHYDFWETTLVDNNDIVFGYRNLDFRCTVGQFMDAMNMSFSDTCYIFLYMKTGEEGIPQIRQFSLRWNPVIPRDAIFWDLPTEKVLFLTDFDSWVIGYYTGSDPHWEFVWQPSEQYKFYAIDCVAFLLVHNDGRTQWSNSQFMWNTSPSRSRYWRQSPASAMTSWIYG